MDFCLYASLGLTVLDLEGCFLSFSLCFLGMLIIKIFPLHKDFLRYTAIKLLYYLELVQLWEKVSPEKILKYLLISQSKTALLNLN